MGPSRRFRAATLLSLQSIPSTPFLAHRFQMSTVGVVCTYTCISSCQNSPTLPQSQEDVELKSGSPQVRLEVGVVIGGSWEVVANFTDMARYRGPYNIEDIANVKRK